MRLVQRLEAPSRKSLIIRAISHTPHIRGLGRKLLSPDQIQEPIIQGKTQAWGHSHTTSIILYSHLESQSGLSTKFSNKIIYSVPEWCQLCWAAQTRLLFLLAMIFVLLFNGAQILALWALR